MVRLVRAIRQQATLSQVVDVLRGANTRAVKDKGHDSLPEHGACKALRCTLVLRHVAMQGGALYLVDACMPYSSEAAGEGACDNFSSLITAHVATAPPQAFG